MDQKFITYTWSARPEIVVIFAHDMEILRKFDNQNQRYFNHVCTFCIPITIRDSQLVMSSHVSIIDLHFGVPKDGSSDGWLIPSWLLILPVFLREAPSPFSTSQSSHHQGINNDTIQ